MLSRRFDWRGAGEFAGCRTITKVKIIVSIRQSGLKISFNFLRLVMFETERKRGDAHQIPISVTDRSQITNLPTDTQILKGRTTWRNLPSVYLILHDFDYLPRFFSVSN
jgi:hypothetical protein